LRCDFGDYVLVVVAPMILIEPNLDLGPFGDMFVLQLGDGFDLVCVGVPVPSELVWW
jgi:hypothetical protein